MEENRTKENKGEINIKPWRQQQQWFDLWLFPEVNKVVIHPVPVGLQKSELSEGAAELPGKQTVLNKTSLSSVKCFFK